jgi:hypothetical protein
MSQVKPLLGACIMMKNESKTIERTLKTCKNVVNCVVILDTGSTDQSMKIAKKVCKKIKVPLFLYENKFVDFSTSRNLLLDRARKHAQFLLLLDSNDEIRNPEQVRTILMKNNKCDIFHTKIHWINDAGLKGYNTNYTRICIINSACTNIQYKNRIHEHLSPKDPSEPLIECSSLLSSQFHIFQDRELDTPSTERFYKDIKILLEDYEVNPQDTRTLFYLGITYRNIHDNENAIIYFDKRVTIGEQLLEAKEKKDQSYIDEVYMSFNHLLELSILSKRSEESITNVFVRILKYMNKFTIERAEHYMIIAGYHVDSQYITKDKLNKAWFFIRKACKIAMPTDPNMVIKSNMYDHIRWGVYLKTAHFIGIQTDPLYLEALKHVSAEDLQKIGPCISFEKRIITDARHRMNLPSDMPDNVVQSLIDTQKNITERQQESMPQDIIQKILTQVKENESDFLDDEEKAEREENKKEEKEKREEKEREENKKEEKEKEKENNKNEERVEEEKGIKEEEDECDCEDCEKKREEKKRQEEKAKGEKEKSGKKVMFSDLNPKVQQSLLEIFGNKIKDI